MSEQKRYTAQEMREEADYCDSVAKETEDIRKIGLEEGEAIPECFHRTICNMLRQAADTEERLQNEFESIQKNIKDWPNHGDETVFAHQLLWMLERVCGAEI